jgi:hypothetical protein
MIAAIALTCACLRAAQDLNPEAVLASAPRHTRQACDAPGPVVRVMQQPAAEDTNL